MPVARSLSTNGRDNSHRMPFGVGTACAFPFIPGFMQPELQGADRAEIPPQDSGFA